MPDPRLTTFSSTPSRRTRPFLHYNARVCSRNSVHCAAPRQTFRFWRTEGKRGVEKDKKRKSGRVSCFFGRARGAWTTCYHDDAQDRNQGRKKKKKKKMMKKKKKHKRLRTTGSKRRIDCIRSRSAIIAHRDWLDLETTVSEGRGHLRTCFESGTLAENRCHRTAGVSDLGRI